MHYQDWEYSGGAAEENSLVENLLFITSKEDTAGACIPHRKQNKTKQNIHFHHIHFHFSPGNISFITSKENTAGNWSMEQSYHSDNAEN